MEGLGRLYNAVPTATTTGTWVNLQDSEALGIFLYGATSGNATVKAAQDASGTNVENFDPTDLPGSDGITVYWTWNAGVWTKHTQAAAATITAATGGLAYVDVAGYQLPAGYNYVTATHSSGSFLILPHDLEVQRRPSNLRSLIV
jgi:hypothetical protein